MGNKANKNFKFRIIDLIIIPLLLVMFLLGGLFFNNYKGTKAYFNIEKTSVDYIIQTPSKEQVNEINGMEHIESVTPYLYSAVDSKINSKTVRVSLFILEKGEDLAKTPFSDELLIEQSQISYDNELFVSDDFAKTNSLEIGDELTLNVYSQSINYKVKAIYSGDKRSVGGVAFAIKTGDLLQAIELKYGTDYKYSGAYISSNNHSETEKWLEDYKPLGDLRSREEFASDELYQIYLENRDKTDYTLTTFYKDKYIEEAHNRYDGEVNRNKSLFIVVQLLSFISIGVFLAVRAFGYLKTEVSKDKRNNFSYKQEQGMFSKYFILMLCVSVLVAMGLVALNAVIFGIKVFEIINILGLILTVLPIVVVWLLQIAILKKRFYS